MRIWIALLCLALLGPTAACATEAKGDLTLKGKPEIINGDTLVIDGWFIKLYGIDAPELEQVCELRGKDYDCGKISRAALLDLTAGLIVECRRSASDPSATMRCFADDYDLSEGMVYTGWALADRKMSLRYVDLEEEAERAERGLWRGTFEPPWIWARRY